MTLLVRLAAAARAFRDPSGRAAPAAAWAASLATGREQYATALGMMADGALAARDREHAVAGALARLSTGMDAIGWPVEGTEAVALHREQWSALVETLLALSEALRPLPDTGRLADTLKENAT